LPRGGFIAANDDVDIQGIEFDTAADAAGGLACDQRRAGSQERVEHDLAFLRQIIQRLDQHRGWLHGRVVLEPLSRIGALRRRARIGPEVRSMASFPTELDIVDVSGFAFLEDRQKLGRPSERKAMIDGEHGLSITKQAKALGISPGSVYYLPRPVSPADLAVMRRMDEMHLEFPFAGSRMLRDLLNREGVEIGRRHVATLMKRMRIEALYPEPNTSKPAPGHKIYPYLLRGVTVERPDQAWAELA